jgi:hypothetical protein
VTPTPIIAPTTIDTQLKILAMVALGFRIPGGRRGLVTLPGGTGSLPSPNDRD